MVILFSFTFDLPPFQLYNRTKLSVVSYTFNGSSAKAVIIKCSDLLVDDNSNHNVDNDAYPTLFVTHTVYPCYSYSCSKYA